MIIKHNIIFWLEKRRKNGVVIEENMPISMRLTFNSNRINFSTGFRIDASKWDENKQRVKNGCTNKAMQSSAEINSMLNHYEAELHSIFKKFETIEVMPTKDQVKDAFNKMHISETSKTEATISISAGTKGKKEKRPRPTDVMAEFIREEGTMRQWTQGTIEKFNALDNHFKDFNPTLAIDEYTEAELTKFLQFLINKKEMRNSTVKKQLGYIKWFFKWCYKKGYNRCTDYREFSPTLKTVRKKVIFLDEDELDKFIYYEIPESKMYLDRVRDVFLFCCFSGLRYSDVYNLKRSDISGGKLWITTIKTIDSLGIKVNDFAQYILDKYANMDIPNNKALPVITNQKMNDYLKELCEMAGIDTPVTEVFFKGGERHEITTPKYALISTHAARRTFVSFGLGKNVSHEDMMSWTGHSDYKAMKPYVGVSDKSLDKAMKVYDEYFARVRGRLNGGHVR